MMRAGPSIGLPFKKGALVEEEKTENPNLLKLRTSVRASNFAISSRDSGYEVQQVGYPEITAVNDN